MIKKLLIQILTVILGASVMMSGCILRERAEASSIDEVGGTYVSEGNEEKDIETVVRVTGLTRTDAKEQRDDIERGKEENGGEQKDNDKAKSPKNEGGDTGEKDSGTGREAKRNGSGDNGGQSDESVLSVYESDSSAGWDGGMEDDSAVSEYSEWDWQSRLDESVYYDSGFEPEPEQYNSGVDEQGYSDADRGLYEESDGYEYEPVPEPEVPDPAYEEPEGTGESLTYLGTWVSTGYCPCSICCGQWASGYTASGTLATEGRTVACGSLPMGTTIYIEGWGYRVVEDLGVEGEWVDIFYSSHEAASAHGLQYVDVYLVN